MKYIVNSLIRFLIYTNIFVAFAAFSLYKLSEIIFQFTNHSIGGFVFFSTLFAYNYMRMINIFFVKKNKLLFFHKHTLICFILLISGFISIYLINQLGWFFLELVFPVILISFLYPLIIRINNTSYSVRSIPLLKVFLIALIWSYVTLLSPLIYESIPLNYYSFDFFFQRFLFVIAISIPFDIRDMYIDNITTLPNTFGIYQSKLFAWFCLFIIDVLLFINLINHSISTPLFIALFLSIELTSIVIYFTNHNRNAVFYGILVEGLSIIMCLFVLIASFF